MLDPVTLLLTDPYVLPLLAASLASLSATLLRRAASILGGWLWGLAGAVSVGAAGATVWAFLWAWGLAAPSSPSLAAGIVGWLVAIAGLALTFWGVATLGRRTFVAGPRTRLESRPPYRYLRRPQALGWTLIGLGASLVLGTSPAWACLIVWLILDLAVVELEEWELRQRLPAAGEYFARTGRYCPRLRRPKS